MGYPSCERAESEFFLSLDEFRAFRKIPVAVETSGLQFVDIRLYYS